MKNKSRACYKGSPYCMYLSKMNPGDVIPCKNRDLLGLYHIHNDSIEYNTHHFSPDDINPLGRDSINVLNKTRYDLVPPEAIKAIADALTDGANKYGAHNWEPHVYLNTGEFISKDLKQVSVMETYAALMRHLQAWISRDETAKDSGLSHLDHVLARATMLKTWSVDPKFSLVDDRIIRIKD